MKPVAESFEIRQNRFSRWFFLLLFLLSAAAFALMLGGQKGQLWIPLVGMVLFGCNLLLIWTDRILISPAGFETKNLLRSRFVEWTEVVALRYEIVYHGHGFEPILQIQAGSRHLSITAKRYQAKPMQRFFEVLNEQCATADKNEHFRNVAEGKMTWKKRIKML